MIIGYGITFAISIVLLVLYCFLVKNKEFWLGMLFVCVSVVNIGYFMLSLANSVEFAIFANDVAYLGSVFLSTCMFFTIIKLCGFTVKKRTGAILLALGAVMFLIVATSGFLPWYYKSVAIETINGATLLVKDYGVLHPLYAAYLGTYFVAMICAIIHSLIKKKGKAQKIAGFLAFIVFINIAVWFVEKFTKSNFEFLSVSYLVSEMLFVFLYWTMQDYVHCSSVANLSQQEDGFGGAITTMSMEEKLNKVLLLVADGETLAVREREILELILKNVKRKEIANQLSISENTVKTYTRTLYAKLGVRSRNELYNLILKK